MSHRAGILARLRRSRTGAAPRVVGLFAGAYLAAGAAPCAAAVHAASEDDPAAHEHGGAHAAHAEHHDHAVHARHGGVGHGGPHAEHESRPAPADDTEGHCVRCPGALARGAAMGYAGGGARPSRSALVPSVALRVRHCVFLI
jgi:hypothetical protein